MTPLLQAIVLAPLVISFALVFVRFVKGPGNLSRLVAFESMAIVTICFAALAGIVFQTPWFFDAILVLSLIGFLSTVAVGLQLGTDKEEAKWKS